MSTQEFRDFVFRSVFADKKDPIAEWRKVSEKQAALIASLAGKKEVRLRAPGTDLKMRVDGRTWINSDGKHNMPSGEIFTGPVEESVEGEITFTYPVVTAGREIDGIRLVFREGRVAEASATKNEDYLRKMISLDDGASRVGELGVGTNYGIDRFVKNILYDEKIGGSIHIALGNSYRETGGRNVSAVHWDMICDLRRGGEMLVDGDVFQKDGAFTV
jgi:aminopeptidase